jgi:colanic acid/amylovoran biosynthesis glycosyltransferase
MSRPLRIAFFLGSFPVLSETFILRQITGLLDLGHEVDIYADYAPDAESPQQPEIAQHKLLARTTYMDIPPASAPWEMPVWPLTGSTWLPGAEQPIRNLTRISQALPTLVRSLARNPRLTLRVLSSAHYGHQAASLSALCRLARLGVVAKCYDVLHAHFGPVGNSYRFAKALWRTPLVVSFHGYDFSSVITKSGRDVYRRLFAEVDALTVNSEFMAGKLREFGCPANKLQKLPYGVDLSRFSRKTSTRTPGEPVRILTIGRLVEKKGLEYSLRAFAQVRQVHPKMRYDIVGDGPLRKQLQGLIEKLGQPDAVTLHGAMEGEAVRALLAKADVFVLASVTASDGDQEGTPVSLLEAQASGIPVLATKHSGIPEIVRDGEGGFLVAERDVDQLAERLRHLVEHPEIRSRAGEAGSAFVAANFEQGACLRQLVNVYEQVVRSSGAGSPQ